MTTLDLLSEGRLEVGMGVGWMTTDYEATGMAHDRAGIRIDRMIEGIKVLRGLWGEDAISFEGDHYTISEMNGLPKPVQAGGPPIIVTDDRDGAAEKVGGGMGMDAATILASPHTLVGSAEQIAEELVEQRERWQGSYVTIQSDAIDSFAPVVAALAGT